MTVALVQVWLVLFTGPDPEGLKYIEPDHLEMKVTRSFEECQNWAPALAYRLRLVGAKAHAYCEKREASKPEEK